LKKLQSNCKRILIEGGTSYNVQGINLRETIEMLVKKGSKELRIKGITRNLKDGNVEAICVGSDEHSEFLLKQVEKWMKDKQVMFKTCNMRNHYDPEAKNYRDFTVERSDDLSEMVWALRGAGNRFKEATDALEEIEQTIITRDKNTSIGRLLSLHNELISNRDQLAKPTKNRQRINTVALECSVENPAIPERGFVFLCGEVYSDLEDFKESDFSDIKKLTSKVDALIELIAKELQIRGVSL
jgi:acylphosphatase